MLEQLKKEYEKELAELLPLHKQLEQQEKELFEIAEKDDNQESLDNYDRVYEQYHKVDDKVYTLEKIIEQVRYLMEIQEELKSYNE